MVYRLNSFAERVAFIHKDCALGHDPRLARDRGDDSVILNLDTSLEDAPDDALLFPDLSRLQFSIFI